MDSLQQTVDQERAGQAWKDIQEVKGQGFESKYGSLSRRVPALILTNGLGQMLAFLKAKGKGDNGNEHEVLYKHLSAWVTRQMGWSKALLEEVIGRASTDYRRATAEAMAYLNWLKRFAEAELKVEEEE